MFSHRQFYPWIFYWIMFVFLYCLYKFLTLSYFCFWMANNQLIIFLRNILKSIFNSEYLYSQRNNIRYIMNVLLLLTEFLKVLYRPVNLRLSRWSNIWNLLTWNFILLLREKDIVLSALISRFKSILGILKWSWNWIDVLSIVLILLIVLLNFVCRITRAIFYLLLYNTWSYLFSILWNRVSHRLWFSGESSTLRNIAQAHNQM